MFEEDHMKNQLEEYQSMIELKQNELEELDGAGDAPTVAQRRLELQAEISEINISVEQLKEQGQQRGQGYDIFED